MGCSRQPSIGGADHLAQLTSSTLKGYDIGLVQWSNDGNRALSLFFKNNQIEIQAAEAGTGAWSGDDPVTVDKLWRYAPHRLVRSEGSLIMLGECDPELPKRAIRTALNALPGQNRETEYFRISSTDQGRTWSSAPIGPILNLPNGEGCRTLAGGQRVFAIDGLQKKEDDHIQGALSEDQGATWRVFSLPIPIPLEERGYQWAFEVDGRGRLHALNYQVDKGKGEERIHGAYYLRSSDGLTFDIVEFVPRREAVNDGYILGRNLTQPDVVYRLYTDARIDEDELVKAKQFQLMCQISNNGGESWGKAFPLREQTHCYSATLRIQGYDALLVASYTELDGRELLAVASVDGGESWSGPQTIAEMEWSSEHRLELAPQRAMFVTKLPNAAPRDDKRVVVTIAQSKS